MFRGLDIPREDKISVITLLLWDAVWTCFLIAMLLHLTGVVDIPAFGGGGEQLFEPIDMGLCIGGCLTAGINHLMGQRYWYDDDLSLKVSTKTYLLFTRSLRPPLWPLRRSSWPFVAVRWL